MQTIIPTILQTEGALAAYPTRIGVSGSRTIPSEQAKTAIANAVSNFPSGCAVITGGCIGVDALVAEIAHNRGLFVVTILPDSPRLIDPRHAQWASIIESLARTYKERNERIVSLSTQLEAFPLYAEMEGHSIRSGTWQTIRMARRAHHLGPRIELLCDYA